MNGSDGRLPAHGLERGAPCDVEVDGVAIRAFEGETVAAALLAAGVRAFRTTAKRAEPRGFFCGIGICHECLVVVDGRPSVRSCLENVRSGMRIRTQRGWFSKAEPASGAD